MSSGERLTTDKKDRADLLLKQAEGAARQNRDHVARRLLKAVLHHDPTNERALLWLVYLAEDGQASLNYLARLLEAHPRHPQARTAVRWARRRLPTSQQTQIHKVSREEPRLAYPPRVAFYGLTILVVLLGLGLFWQWGRPSEAPVQAGELWSTVAASLPAPTPRPLMDIVRVSIPLFTARPRSTATPAHTPTPTPSSAWVPVIGLPQTYNMSCESRSAADLAAFWNVSLTELEILTALGQSDNPHRGFVGNVGAPPGSLPPYGYGVYVEPLAATLRSYGLDARPVYNLGLDGLRAELLAGRPVLVWATYGMETHEPIEWTSSDGRVSTIVPYMHTFLVTGFDESGFSMVDAYDGTIQRYAFDTFLSVWNLFDQMALVVAGPLP